MKIFMTGADRFPGHQVAAYLLEQGHEITAIAKTKAACPEHKNMTVVKGDLESKELDDLTAAAEGAQAVVHFHEARLNDEDASYQANVQSTLNLLKVLGAQKFTGPLIYASSAAVYGDMAASPQVEYRLGTPLSLYAKHKQQVEKYMEMYGLLHKFKHLGLRLFNVYGPGEDGNDKNASAIARFSLQAKNGKPLTIFGKGELVRDFVHVDDVAKAVEAALTSTKVGVVNVGTGKGVKLMELADNISKHITKKQPSIEYIDAPEERQIPSSIADLRRLKDWLGVTPTIKVEKGLGDI